MDEDGNTMTDEEKLALQDGDVVTVRATVKNTHPDAGKEIVYDHLTLVPEDDEKVKKYPTAGLDILTGAEQTVTVDGKAVTNASGQPYDVSGEGIPFGCTAAGNVITYKAKINNPDGKSVTVGQRMSDDFFGSKQYSGAELIPAQPLVPADPEKPAGEAGKDYHYTRTSPNENGWNNSDVAITFYPGDFNQFYIKDPEEGTVHATLTSEKEPLLYTDETETPVALQAENSESGAKSVRNDDVIKVDKVPPTLTAASPAPALFGFRRAAAPASAVTLADNLSGIWKLERYDAASKEWVAAETFDLPTEGAEKGNGKASESATIDQNGLYRAVDAAGNVGEPTPVSFNAPPSVTPTDPEAPALEPEEETDEGGLRHAVASDSMSEYIDKAAPLYGGRFTLEDAAELMAQRYGFASNVERDDSLRYTYAITQKGADVSGQGVDTTQAGSFVVVCTATDADGNTTTLYLTDTLIDPDAPPLVERQEEGTPPVGPPFDPLKPVPQPVIKEDTETGRYHAYVYEQIAEGVREPGAYGGSLTGAVAQQIFAGRYGFVSQQGDGELRLSPICVTQDGKDVSAAGYDTAKPGSCVISQTATDSRGNKTTVYLTYTFLPVGSPPWVAYDPSDPTVEPGSELEEPEIVEDWQSGTKYATVTDRLVQTITDPPLSDGWLDGEELRAFLRQPVPVHLRPAGRDAKRGALCREPGREGGGGHRHHPAGRVPDRLHPGGLRRKPHLPLFAISAKARRGRRPRPRRQFVGRRHPLHRDGRRQRPRGGRALPHPLAGPAGDPLHPALLAGAQDLPRPGETRPHPLGRGAAGPGGRLRRLPGLSRPLRAGCARPPLLGRGDLHGPVEPLRREKGRGEGGGSPLISPLGPTAVNG